MTQRRYRQFRWARRLAVLMAAAPVFQLAQCSAGVRQVSASMFNALPSTLFSIMESILLAPIQLFLNG